MNIDERIYVVRGKRVMMDSDLALLYGVETKYLNRQVRRNIERFPSDFMFRLNQREVFELLNRGSKGLVLDFPQEDEEVLRCQIGTSKLDDERRGGRTHLPYVFTELGVAMLSSVLRSKKAIDVNIKIMRAFVRMRKMLSSGEEVRELRSFVLKHSQKTSQEFKKIWIVLDRLGK